MNQEGNDDIKKNMKEATALLNVLDLNDDKLERILASLSDMVREKPALQSLVGKLAERCAAQEAPVDLDHLNELMGTKDVLPMIATILNDMSQDPDIINHFEKEILPILFNR